MSHVHNFTSRELARCAVTGMARNEAGWRNGWSLGGGVKRKDFGIEAHIVGAMGELAVAQLLKITWRPVIGELDTKRGDLPGRLQIKSVHQSNYRLLLRESDPEDFRYVLVYLTVLQATVIGWMHGSEVKQDNFKILEGDGPFDRLVYAVPQNLLHPMNELKL